jgi:catechol 2,3-dioxygenase-like lactoylglutathione lyase family enzyme
MIRGIGGVFLYADDAKALVEWYTKHLGIEFAYESEECSYYRDFVLPVDPAYGRTEHEVFAIRQAGAKRTDASPRLVINLRVADLAAVLDRLRNCGAEVERVQDYEYGRFAWLMDLEGNQLELFEPC